MVFPIKILLVAFFIFLFSVNVVFAQTPSPKTTFEAFWPLTAGKTIDDPLYFLKVWKENFRGMFIFGNPKKAEYAVYLGTKRVLEADKLLEDGKKDLADQTLSKAIEQFDIAEKNISGAKIKKLPLESSVQTIKPRLENLVNFVPTIQLNETEKLLEKLKKLNLEI